MRTLLAALLLALLPACASGPQSEPIMAVMATTWSVVVVPNVQEAVANEEALTLEQRQAVTSALASVQRMLDSGTPTVALDIFNEWRSLRSLAEMGIYSRVEAGKLDPLAGAGLIEALRQFEIQLTRLLAHN